MSAMRLACVAEMPDRLPAIARTYLQAVGPLLPEWNLDQVLIQLRRHTCDGLIPTTWIALDHTQALGSVNLLKNDRARTRQCSPWLASLYVQLRACAQGIGKTLVALCVTVAARSGVRLLHLYRQLILVPFDQRLGWQTHARFLLGPLQIVVMRMTPGVATQ